MGKKRNPIYDIAYESYLTGLSLDQVAKQINVSRQSVFKAFKKRNFQLRGPNFQPEQTYDGKKFTLRPNGYYELTTEGRTLMHRFVYEKEVGKIPDGWDVHHLDENRANNHISNLHCLSKSDHTKLHGFKNNQHTIKNKQCG